MDGLDDIEVLVGRAIRTIVAISRRVSRFAGRMLLAATVIGIGSFVLGIAALDGGIETVWIVLGAAFASFAIGSALVGWWGVRRIRKDVPAITGELRRMISEGEQHGETILRQFGQHVGGDGDASLGGSAIIVSRHGFGLGGLAGQGLGNAARLTAAVTAVTRFPLLALASIAITTVFAFLAAIFLLALAL